LFFVAAEIEHAFAKIELQKRLYGLLMEETVSTLTTTTTSTTATTNINNMHAIQKLSPSFEHR
jgi:hypothetical protein